MTDIYAFIKEKIDDLSKTTLQDFVRLANQSRAFDPDWKTDGMNEKAATFAVDFANKLQIPNFTVKMYKDGDRTPCVIGVLDLPDKKDAPTILMYGHLDKQPPLTDDWTPPYKPYEPILTPEGRLYGRGAADDGYAFFSCALIIQALQKFNLLKNRIVLFFETDEESGSQDLTYYLEKNIELIGTPSLVICLDSGCCDWEHWCLTTTLRGVVNFSVKVEVLKEGVHSGSAGGIVPDSFRIGRKILEQFESSDNGQLLIDDFYVNIPDDKYHQAVSLIEAVGGKIDWKFPFVDGVQPTVEDGFKQYLNRIWMPQMTLIGMDGVPNVSQAGNVLRPFTTFGLSIRLPPTLDKDKVHKILTDFFDNLAKPYNAKVTLSVNAVGQGFNSPTLSQEFEQVLQDAATKHFGSKYLGYGEGGSIPFINELNQKFPKSSFIVTGVLGPESNAHGPNEFLDVPYLKKLSCCLADVLSKFN